MQLQNFWLIHDEETNKQICISICSLSRTGKAVIIKADHIKGGLVPKRHIIFIDKQFEPFIKLKINGNVNNLYFRDCKNMSNEVRTYVSRSMTPLAVLPISNTTVLNIYKIKKHSIDGAINNEKLRTFKIIGNSQELANNYIHYGRTNMSLREIRFL